MGVGVGVMGIGWGERVITRHMSHICAQASYNPGIPGIWDVSDVLEQKHLMKR